MGLFDFLMKQVANQPVVKLAPPRRVNDKTVKPDNTPLHVKRGWNKSGNMYRGYYRTKHGAWRGEIERRGDKFNVFIFNPPEEQIEKHPRWPCFHKEGGGKWRINLAINPKDGDPGAIIFFVERVLMESFRK